MSCVRESSPLQDFDSDSERNVGSKRRFWNPKRWFKRKSKHTGEDVVVVEVTEIGKDALRSRSTSELSVTDEGRRRSSSSMHPGLSVSHDSIFHSPNSGSDMELDNAQSSSSLSISQPLGDLRLQTELTEKLRLRRGRGDFSEDDEGLPHSPCNSPTASDGLLVEKTAIKDLPTKSHSSCSDGSLLSMGSCDDEESYEQHSRNSSKISLQDKKTNQDSDAELSLRSNGTPLNHSAAHHRVSLKPKRTHGAPKRKRPQTVLSQALPVTIEVNEEPPVRCASPELTKKESLSELYSARTLTETQLKCSSLPPGLSAPAASRLNRSKSNAGAKSQDLFAKSHEHPDEKDEKTSLLGRFFPRKSSRRKKKGDKEARSEEEAITSSEREWETSITKQETTVTDSMRSVETTVVTTRKVESSKPVPAVRMGVASRQRVVPMDIPEPQDEGKKEQVLRKSSPERDGASPLHLELESKFKQRQISLSTSPADEPPPPRQQPPPEPDPPTVISPKHDRPPAPKSPTKHAEPKPNLKLKMPGLSSLQQRVLSLNDHSPEDSFRSLTEPQTVKPLRPIAKSHSFKTVKISSETAKNKTEDFLKREKDDSKVSFTKAVSLDSVKHLDEPVKSEEQAGITISGPSHTAVVNVTSNLDNFSNVSKSQTCETIDGSTTISIKEQQVSITKIQVKKTTQAPKPEFLNKQLHKVEIKPTSNVILSMKSPKDDAQTRPKTLFNFDVDPEISSKPPPAKKPEDSPSPKTPPVTLSASSPRFKKKSSIVSINPESPVKEKPAVRRKSSSLSSLNDSDKSSQDSLERLDDKRKDNKESPVVLRRKSTITKTSEDEPELMKVFARRSLKLKDGDIEALQESINDSKTRDSDKENRSDSPVDERRKIEEKPRAEKPKPAERKIEQPEQNCSPIVLRRSLNHNVFVGQRAVSINPAKADFIIKKQTNFSEHRKTEQWMSHIRNDDVELKEKIAQDEMLAGDFIMEQKNVSQMKAEWEKRANLAKKTTP
ncbi:unnamed protein product [Phyllotreta striolata]|uniref:Uncharacterized protein n=1 Tax=Phyllotreta striolata TaxID=444603 RepID=A0A9N9TUZ6_PHYSR|nr:unnamed protein product [Phyllotreta striolata]